MTAVRAAWLAAAALFVVYAATLAPSVTFWDAGEFIAAARTLGIPHPPGTPLYIVVLNAWAKVFGFLPFAAATNLFSAACTAAAVGLTAFFVANATRSPIVGLASGVAAGAMSSVWQSATETEVYAVSLFLAVAAIAAGDRAGRTNDDRWLVLSAFLLALALPLHASALVAAPVVILLAADRVHAPRDLSAGFALAAVFVAVIGASRLSPLVMGIGLLALVASVWIGGPTARRQRVIRVLFIGGSAVVACSALLFLLIRARHDPAINQGNPTTWSELADVVGRVQYAVPGVWPRRAPLWLQFANWFEYADWQFALSLGPTVIPTVARVFATIVFTGLGLIGATWHHGVDRRSWRAVALLFLCGSVGVVLYLNLKAGASFGWAFVPSDDGHEARDRDYFFVLGFWAWGIWAAMGAIALARRLKLPANAGVIVAALPLVLNWKAVTRRGEPDASLPRAVAAALLDPLPQRTVLFVAGDNDTYPLWYAQQVEHRRRDVTVLTIPLLGASWYAREMERRHGLAPAAPVSNVGVAAADIARAARAAGRPVAASIAVPSGERNLLSKTWTVIGLSLIDETLSPGRNDQSNGDSLVIRLDTVAISRAASAIDAWTRNRTVRTVLDPTNDYFQRVLSCPRWMLARQPANAQLTSLDSLCNPR